MDLTSRTSGFWASMPMLGACEDAQVGHLLAAQFATGQHALNGFHDDALGVRALKDLALGAWI